LFIILLILEEIEIYTPPRHQRANMALTRWS